MFLLNPLRIRCFNVKERFRAGKARQTEKLGCFPSFRQRSPRRSCSSGLSTLRNSTMAAACLGKMSRRRVLPLAVSATIKTRLSSGQLCRLRQTSLLQIADHHRQISAGGQNFPGDVRQRHRPQMIKRFQDGELGQGQVGATETAGGIAAGRVGGAHQLDIGAQRQTLLRSIGLRSGHDCLC